MPEFEVEAVQRVLQVCRFTVIAADNAEAMRLGEKCINKGAGNGIWQDAESKLLTVDVIREINNTEVAPC